MINKKFYVKFYIQNIAPNADMLMKHLSIVQSSFMFLSKCFPLFTEYPNESTLRRTSFLFLGKLHFGP